jgi:hypothetical protein
VVSMGSPPTRTDVKGNIKVAAPTLSSTWPTWNGEVWNYKTYVEM